MGYFENSLNNTQQFGIHERMKATIEKSHMETCPGCRVCKPLSASHPAFGDIRLPFKPSDGADTSRPSDGHCPKCGAYHDLTMACTLPTEPIIQGGQRTSKGECLPPEVIYLQYHGDGPPNDGPVRDCDVSWCRDRIFPSDLEYVCSCQNQLMRQALEAYVALHGMSVLAKEALSK